MGYLFALHPLSRADNLQSFIFISSSFSLCVVWKLDGNILCPTFQHFIWPILMSKRSTMSWTYCTFRTLKFQANSFVCICRSEFIWFVLDGAFTRKQSSQLCQWSDWQYKKPPSFSSQFSHPKHLTMPVEINRLALKSSQLDVIQCIYSEQCEVILRFSDITHDQKDAQDFLTSHLLNHTSWQNLESWWNIQWSNAWSIGKSGDQQCRSLVQW